MKKAFLFLGLSVLLFSNSAEAQNLPSYLPSNGLVGWWPFNGNANDESGNGNDGIVNGALLGGDRSGSLDNSFSFNGLSDVIQVSDPANNTFDFLGLDFSISVWVKTISNQSGNPVITKQSLGLIANVSGDYNLDLINGLPRFAIGFGNGEGADRLGLIAVNDNSWHHLIAVYSNLGINIYIDGVSSNGASTSPIQFPSSLANSIEDLRIGQGWNSHFSGLIDDIAIYNRALTQEEIAALYTGTPVNGGGGNTSANPVPPGIPYQAVVRNANGSVAANTAVTTRFTLHQNTADGAVEFQETHSLTTNAQGLMATVLGQGTAVQNTFAAINWANTTKFLQVEVDLGNGYVDLGTQQLMSVPYSIQSQTAFTLKNTGLPVYADNAAALAGGLTTGQLYRTSTGDLKIVY
jgi:hypothetical protein